MREGRSGRRGAGFAAGELIVDAAAYAGHGSCLGDCLAAGNLTVGDVEFGRAPPEALIATHENREAAAVWLLAPIPAGVDELGISIVGDELTVVDIDGREGYGRCPRRCTRVMVLSTSARNCKGK